MKYHNITKDDMLNGEGLRVVLWTAGCKHHCKNCQNPITWDPNYGLEFDEKAKQEIFAELEKEYISGITLSGGDPLHENNLKEIGELIATIREKYPNKTIWLYSGYTWEELKEKENRFRQIIVNNVDVFVDGKFVEEKKDTNYPYAGSTNQRVIMVKETIGTGMPVLWKSRFA